MPPVTLTDLVQLGIVEDAVQVLRWQRDGWLPEAYFTDERGNSLWEREVIGMAPLDMIRDGLREVKRPA